MGGTAVITRSFARIHEANLKKQGLLALNFKNEPDYDKVQPTDKITLKGVKDNFHPGSEITMVCKHKDGSVDEFPLTHTYNQEQIQWFINGSALNLMKAQAEGKS